jgi:hypothetical protein
LQKDVEVLSGEGLFVLWNTIRWYKNLPLSFFIVLINVKIALYAGMIAKAKK